MMKKGYISKGRVLRSIVVYPWKYTPFTQFIGPQLRNDQLVPIMQNSVLFLPIGQIPILIYKSRPITNGIRIVVKR